MELQTHTLMLICAAFSGGVFLGRFWSFQCSTSPLKGDDDPIEGPLGNTDTYQKELVSALHRTAQMLHELGGTPQSIRNHVLNSAGRLGLTATQQHQLLERLAVAQAADCAALETTTQLTGQPITSFPEIPKDYAPLPAAEDGEFPEEAALGLQKVSRSSIQQAHRQIQRLNVFGQSADGNIVDSRFSNAAQGRLIDPT